MTVVSTKFWLVDFEEQIGKVTFWFRSLLH